MKGQNAGRSAKQSLVRRIFGAPTFNYVALLATLLGAAGSVITKVANDAIVSPSGSSASVNVPVTNPAPDPKGVRVWATHPQEIGYGDDLLVGVHAVADGWGTLTLTAHKTGSLEPIPETLSLELSPGVEKQDKFVVSKSSVGNRTFLISGSFVQNKEERIGASGSLLGGAIQVSGSARAATREPLPPARTESAVVSFNVLPRTTFGMTEEELKAIQIFSGIVGIPGIIALVLSFMLGRKTKKDEKAEKEAETRRVSLE